MARLPRLSLPGHPHLVIQRGNAREAIVRDDIDRRLYLELLREAALLSRVAVHAYVLVDDEVQLLATPIDRAGLSRTLQTLGRRYVGAFNRRHGRSGTLWEGRFRAGIIESERYFLMAMACIELEPVRAGLAADAGDWRWSSAAHHLGQRRDPLVADHPAYWALGNTPFEREGAYRAILDEGVGPADVARITEAAAKGWVLGSDTFVRGLALTTPRPLQPRPRGRPRKIAA